MWIRPVKCVSGFLVIEKLNLRLTITPFNIFQRFLIIFNLNFDRKVKFANV